MAHLGRSCSPTGKGRPQITGVLPSDVSKGRLGGTVTKKQGVTFDLMNVTGVDEAQLRSLSSEIAEIRGLQPPG